jgi:hypothetical protein
MAPGGLYRALAWNGAPAKFFALFFRIERKPIFEDPLKLGHVAAFFLRAQGWRGSPSIRADKVLAFAAAGAPRCAPSAPAGARRRVPPQEPRPVNRQINANNTCPAAHNGLVGGSTPPDPPVTSIAYRTLPVGNPIPTLAIALIWAIFRPLPGRAARSFRNAVDPPSPGLW